MVHLPYFEAAGCISHLSWSRLVTTDDAGHETGEPTTTSYGGATSGADPTTGADVAAPMPAQDPQQPPNLARYIFELHMPPRQRQHWSQNKGRGAPEHRQGLYGLVTAGKGERGHASEFPRSAQSQTTHETRAQEGHERREDCRCQHKKD